MEVFLGYLAFGLSAFAYIPYWWNIYRHGARPTISAWVSWFLLDTTITVNLLSAGQMPWQMTAFTCGSAITLAIALVKKSDLGWGKIDTYCVALVVASLCLWAIAGQKAGLICSLIAAIIGSAPMLINLWENPSNEKWLPWGMIFLGSIVQVFALPAWDMWTLATPMTWIVLQVSVLTLIFRNTPHPRH